MHQDTFKAHFAGVDIPIKAIENGQVWREDRLINPNGGLEWFESPFPQPDALLQEMVQVVNWESASQSGYFPRVWLRHLSLGEQPIVKVCRLLGDVWSLAWAVTGDCCRLSNTDGCGL